MKNIFVILYLEQFFCPNCFYYNLNRKNMRQRKVLIGIAIAIFILLLLYWLVVAEDMSAWLPVAHVSTLQVVG